MAASFVYLVMPIDFDWQEGSHRFDLEAAQVQSVSAPVPTLVPRRAPATPLTAPRLSNLALLAIGVTLGIIAGFALLTFEGQRNARADVAPTIRLQHEALLEKDSDLYRGSLDGADPVWQAAMLADMPQTALLFDPEAPRVRRVSLQGDHAEVDVIFEYDGRTYHRLDTMRLQGERWLQTPDPVGDWGATQTASGSYVTLEYRERDAFVAALLPRMDAAARAFCNRYKTPSPCQIDLSIEPNPALLPFVPGRGVAEPLPASAPATEGIPVLRLASPRLVGWRGDEPHPLWWLGLHEAVGEAILRQSLATVTGDEQAANTMWAAARGDVAVWAERMSGVRLPAAALSSLPDPALVGASLAAGDATQRNAARDFALYLHVTLGETALLEAMDKARSAQPIETALFGQPPDALAAAWRDWAAARLQQEPTD